MITTDYALSKPLATALKAKSPYVGIPLPGHVPLVFERAKLQRMLKGVAVQEIWAEGNGNERALRVKGVAGRVRCSYRIFAIPAHRLRERDILRRRTTFAESAAKPKESAIQKKIAKLEAERFSILKSLRQPSPRVWQQYERDAWLHWYQDKQRRRDPKFRDVLTRINEGGCSKPWCIQADSYREPKYGPERYWMFRDDRYLSIREELNALKQIQAMKDGRA